VDWILAKHAQCLKHCVHVFFWFSLLIPDGLVITCATRGNQADIDVRHKKRSSPSSYVDYLYGNRVCKKENFEKSSIKMGILCITCSLNSSYRIILRMWKVAFSFLDCFSFMTSISYLENVIVILAYAVILCCNFISCFIYFDYETVF